MQLNAMPAARRVNGALIFLTAPSRTLQGIFMTDAAAAIKLPATDGTAAISLRSLSKRFGEGVLAVDDLSLDVPAGQIYGLIGPNGAGKTTVLRMLLGLIHPTKGMSYIFGERIR